MKEKRFPITEGLRTRVAELEAEIINKDSEISELKALKEKGVTIKEDKALNTIVFGIEQKILSGIKSYMMPGVPVLFKQIDEEFSMAVYHNESSKTKSVHIARTKEFVPTSEGGYEDAQLLRATDSFKYSIKFLPTDLQERYLSAFNRNAANTVRGKKLNKLNVWARTRVAEYYIQENTANCGATFAFSLNVYSETAKKTSDLLILKSMSIYLSTIGKVMMFYSDYEEGRFAKLGVFKNTKDELIKAYNNSGSRHHCLDVVHNKTKKVRNPNSGNNIISGHIAFVSEESDEDDDDEEYYDDDE